LKLKRASRTCAPDALWYACAENPDAVAAESERTGGAASLPVALDAFVDVDAVRYSVRRSEHCSARVARDKFIDHIIRVRRLSPARSRHTLEWSREWPGTSGGPGGGCRAKRVSRGNRLPDRGSPGRLTVGRLASRDCPDGRHGAVQTDEPTN